jgi:hypothetical protein
MTLEKTAPARLDLLGWSGAIWGLAVVSLLLASAIRRLTPIALDAFSGEFLPRHWVCLALSVGSMAYYEGYRAFQKAFSPRVAARARYLKERPGLGRALLAPFFCMAFFHAPRRRIITSVSVTAGIILLVLLVRRLSQPWRGIVDAGVVVGLAWGLISLWIYGVCAFVRPEFSHPPEVP